MSVTESRPRRIQRQRTKGWRMPEGAVYVGRPSMWGNPWTLNDARAFEIVPPERRAEWCVGRYREELKHWGLHSDYAIYVSDRRWEESAKAIEATGARNMAEYAATALKGKDLVCWCPLDQPCHADVLLRVANA